MSNNEKKHPEETFFGVLFRKRDPSPNEQLATRADVAERQKGKTSYLRYLFSIWKRGKLYFLYRRSEILFRPFFWVYRAFRLLFLAVAWIETSAVFLLLFLVFLALLPAIFLLFFAFFSYALFRDRIAARHLLPLLHKNRVIFLYGENAAFLSSTEREKTLLFLVSDRATDRGDLPSLFFAPYLALGKDCYRIRESLFFRLLPLLTEEEGIGVVY